MAEKKKSTKEVKNTLLTQEDREKAIRSTLDQIEKEYGQGAAMLLGQNIDMNIEVISTGSIAIDRALGIGGLPKGRIIEIYGHESSGKTTLALHAVAEAQKNGGIAAFVDAEHALDPVYAKALGVDIDQLIISQPDSGEQALAIVDTLVNSGVIDILVVDSVAALVPRVELEGEMTDQSMGLHARLMSKAMRKLTSTINKKKTVAIFINQVREKIGANTYAGPAETTTGGRALKFYSSIRIDVRRGEQLKKGEEVLGSKMKIKVAKNKLAPPFKTAVVDIDYGRGISKTGEIVDYGVEAGIIKKSGSWFSYGDVKLGQGKENVKELLLSDSNLMEELREKILDYLGDSKDSSTSSEENKISSDDMNELEMDFLDEL